jgi:hypothetical protein
LPCRRAACQSVSARIGASNPEIVVPKGFLRSSMWFETMPVARGGAPVTIVTWETAVSDGLGGTDRTAKKPRSARRRNAPAGSFPGSSIRDASRCPPSASKEMSTARRGCGPAEAARREKRGTRTKPARRSPLIGEILRVPP